MPLPIYDAQDAIPEDSRDDYVEHEGKWHPKVVVELAAEKKKKAALLNEKKEEERLRKEAEQKLADAQRAAEARDKGISEEELKRIRETEAAARRPIEEERDRLAAENRQLKLTDRVQALYLANGGMSDRVEDAMDQLSKRTDIGDAGGIVFKDKDGNVTAEDAKAFFEKFATEKPWLFEGTGSSGSGASGSGGSGGQRQNSTTQAQALERKRQSMPGSL
jgi:hypothetical protein